MAQTYTALLLQLGGAGEVGLGGRGRGGGERKGGEKKLGEQGRDKRRKGREEWVN